MKMTALLVATAMACAVPVSARAQGIPVYDNTSTLQLIAQVQNTLHQIQQGEQIITQANNTYNSLSKLTNVATIAAVLNDRNVSQILPAGVPDIIRLGQSDYTSLGNFGTAAQGISSQYTIQTNLGQSGTLSSAATTTYNRYLASVNQTPAIAATLSYNVSTQSAQVDAGLDQLRTQISSSQDPKDTLDLTARATIENAKINNRLLQFLAMQQYHNASARLGYNAYRLSNAAARMSAADARIAAAAAAYPGY